MSQQEITIEISENNLEQKLESKISELQTALENIEE
jgi:hypothetical protein